MSTAPFSPRQAIEPDSTREIADVVAAVDPTPRSPVDTAIVLEMLGYNDERARVVGADDLFDLGNRVYGVLAPQISWDTPEVVEPCARWPSAAMLAHGLMFSGPWFGAMMALLLARTSLWSTITTPQFSSAISLALFIGLVLSGAFVQAYARRGMFYWLQGNRPMLVSLSLRLGAVVLVVAVTVYSALYVLFEDVLSVYTPQSNLHFFEFGLAITALLTAFAPLYMLRAFDWLCAAAVLGIGYVVVAARASTRGQYLNTYRAMHIGLLGIAIVVVTAIVGDAIVLRRAGVDGGTIPRQAVRRPRKAAALASVAPYSAYGAGFFALLCIDQLIAGGLAHGRYLYNGRYELAAAVALILLIPTLAYAVGAQELFPSAVKHTLARVNAADASECAHEIRRFYRRHLRVVIAVGSVMGIALGVVAADIGAHAGPGSVLPNVRPEFGVFVAALAAYVFLSVGAFNAGLLFALSSPSGPVIAIASACATSVTVGITLERVAPLLGPALGLLAGCVVFAVISTAATSRVTRHFLPHYYAAA